MLEEAHRNRFDQALKQLAPYAVNKQDKAQEKIDRDYLKSVQNYSHYALAPLRQNKEKIEDFKNRQAAFEQEFKLTDPQGYQQALKDKEERRQTNQQQQDQILSDLKQRFNVQEKGTKVQSLEANQTPQRALESQQLVQELGTLQNKFSDGIVIPGQVIKPTHYDSQISAKELREKLNSRMEDLAFELLEPVHGKPTSRTSYTRRYGNKGSLCVYVSGPKQGLFMNYETDQGGDALKLIQNHYGTDYKEAYKWASSWLGENQKNYELTAKDKGLSSKEKNREETQWTPIFPAPKEFPDLNSYSLRYMMKDKTEKAHFAYKDAEGNILGYVVRLEDAEGRKSTPPLTYCRNDKGQTQWKWKGFVGEDRPLYGLDQLALKKEATVLVVEGEKAAEAAKKLFPDYAVVSWMGGSYGVSKADWSVLKDREVVMWPDQDEPGRKAAHKIQEILITHQNPNVAIVEVPSIFPAKWDLADTLPEGVQHQDLRNYVSAAKIARKYELFDQEQKINIDVSDLAVSSPSYQSTALSIEEGRGRAESSIIPQEKDVLAYYQSLEEENKKLLSAKRTPEQQQRAETLNKEMEETAYAISNNPALMEEAHKRNLTNHIMVDREAYLESQGEKKAITVNDLAVETPVVQQQTLKTEEASLVQTIVGAEVNPSPALSAVSERELVKGYLEIDEKIKALPTFASRSEEEKERYKELFNSSLEMSYQISQSAKAMEAITVLGLEENVTLKAENYQRIYKPQTQSLELKTERTEMTPASPSVTLEDKNSMLQTAPETPQNLPEILFKEALQKHKEAEIQRYHAQSSDYNEPQIEQSEERGIVGKLWHTLSGNKKREEKQSYQEANQEERERIIKEIDKSTAARNDPSLREIYREQIERYYLEPNGKEGEIENLQQKNPAKYKEIEEYHYLITERNRILIEKKPSEERNREYKFLDQLSIEQAKKFFKDPELVAMAKEYDKVWHPEIKMAEAIVRDVKVNEFVRGLEIERQRRAHEKSLGINRDDDHGYGY